MALLLPALAVKALLVVRERRQAVLLNTAAVVVAVQRQAARARQADHPCMALAAVVAVAPSALALRD